MNIYPKNIVNHISNINIHIPIDIIVIILKYATINFDFYVDTHSKNENIINPYEIKWLKLLNFYNSYYHSNIIFKFTQHFSGIHKLYFKINEICENPHDIACKFPRFRIRKDEGLEPHGWGAPINYEKSPTCLYACHCIEGKWKSLHLKKNAIVQFVFDFNANSSYIYINNLKVDIEYHNLPDKFIFGVECVYNSKISFINYEII